MRRLSLRGQIPGFWKVVLMGDYKMSQVEQVERDRSRAREDNSYWVQRPEVDRLVAAAVEERDSEWRERIEEKALMCDDHAGRFDDPEFPAMAEALRSLLSPDGRSECPDCEGESIEGRGCRTCNSTGKVEAALVAPAVTTSAGVNTNNEEDENLG